MFLTFNLLLEHSGDIVLLLLSKHEVVSERLFDYLSLPGDKHVKRRQTEVRDQKLHCALATEGMGLLLANLDAKPERVEYNQVQKTD